MKADLIPGQRLVRLLRIVSTLSTRPHKRRELANLFGVSERQIQDDIALLRRAGIEIVSVPWRGYVVRNLSLLPGLSAHRGEQGYRLVADRLAPGYVVSVQGPLIRLVWLAQKGSLHWVEEEVTPQPPERLLWAAVAPAHGRRGLYPLTPTLAEWVKENLGDRV